MGTERQKRDRNRFIEAKENDEERGEDHMYVRCMYPRFIGHPRII